MLHLLKKSLTSKSLTSKSFYTLGYKKVGRIKTVFYALFISVILSLLVTPLMTIESYNQFNSLKDELLDLPPKLEINFNSNEGLSTNVNSPVILNASENTLLILDPNASYNEHSSEKTEVIFRKKGFMIYENGSLAEQSSYNMPEFVELNLTGSQIAQDLDTLDYKTFIFIVGGITFIFNILSALFSLLLVSLMFGSVSFLAGKFLKKKETFLQNTKKMVFLGTFFIIGLAINQIALGQFPYADIILMGIGYLWLIR